MKRTNAKFFVYKLMYTLTLVFVLLANISYLQGEEYSIRKKKVPKKQETQNKSSENTNPIGFSRENNKISNQFWLEEGAIYSPESLDSSAESIPAESIPVTTPDTPPPLNDQKPKEEITKGNERPIVQTSQKPNIVLHFLSENKKVLLILGLITIFAIYRLRGDSPSSKNQNTRIFSKFRNK